MMKNKNRLMLYTGTALIVMGIVVACAPAATPPPPTPTPAPTAGEAGQKATTEEPAAEEVARPSNAGGPGPAIGLTGDPKAGEKVYVDSCQKCHGEQGQGGVDNPGSDDGTIPPVNPIDETMVSKDSKVFATNIDLFIEHGSKPEGDNPKEIMAAWGDDKKLTPQQIADVIAYVISLNTK
jgi:mono/diheme cytochrome c family protein